MSRSNDFSCSSKISRSGNGISDISSRFQGWSSVSVRRMKNDTRSTFGSSRNIERKKRWSQLGRPQTCSTRTRSRITLRVNTWRLLVVSASPASTGVAISNTKLPGRSGVQSKETFCSLSSLSM